MTTTKHTPLEIWVLGAGRTIKTPRGEFYLTYGCDKNGNPLFHDFCELDEIARAVVALPELLAAAKRGIAALAANGAPNCEAAKELRAALDKARLGP